MLPTGGLPRGENVMRGSSLGFGAAERTTAAAAAAPAPADADPVRRLFAPLPRPVRFLAVGGLGLITDLAVFTTALAHGAGPLTARAISLTVATLLTWRLNRALTFGESGRRPGEEAMRYATVAAIAQGASYSVFALLVLAGLTAIPQLAVLTGAAAGALVSYAGQALFAFRPGRQA
jgi:putative flippase GtrA